MARKTKKKTTNRLAAIAGGRRKPRAPKAVLVREPAPVRIVAISAFAGHLQGTSTCYGLGDDGRLYCWDGKIGTWLPNWNVAAAPVQDGAAADKVAA